MYMCVCVCELQKGKDEDKMEVLRPCAETKGTCKEAESKMTLGPHVHVWNSDCMLTELTRQCVCVCLRDTKNSDGTQ